MEKKKHEPTQYRCSTCGQVHDELPAFGFRTPYHYDILSDEAKKTIAEISDDFCIIRHPGQTDRFIRATLTIPINDACEDLDYGIWVSLSEKNFNEYLSEFHDYTSEKTYFGTICNKIPAYAESTIGLPVNVVTSPEGLRPELVPHQSKHALVDDWEKGITIEAAENRVEWMLKT